jgi:transmembrane sensor
LIGRRPFLAGGLAAGAASVLLAPRVYEWWMTDFAAPVGQQASLVLPDGSKAVLNSGSTLRVAYGPDLRLVVLTGGDAEFFVERDQLNVPFRLSMLGGNTDMHSGRLSARIDEHGATIAIVEEEASLFGPAGERAAAADFPNAMRLLRNQQSTYRAGDAPGAPVRADLEVALAWRQNKVIFEAKPFAAAIAELGRYVSEPVVLRPGIDRDLPVSGIFSTKEPIVALRTLARTQLLTVRQVPGLAIIVA